ncbi:MAG: hypothetical protein HZB68_04005 [Candidatus Aenigmarchaeota archaeon]|nr:hypothetical protein [Candidatus Aenigmarchaeota archaeon]
MVRRIISEGLNKGLRPSRLLSLLPLFAVLIFSIILIKHGVRELGPDFNEWLKSNIRNVPSAIGYSWIASMFILSGSPIAAIAIGLKNAGVISAIQLFGSIIGSRIGAVSIAFFIGIVTSLGDKSLRRGFSIGTAAFVTTLIMNTGTLFFGTMLYPLRFLISSTPKVSAADPLGPLDTAAGNMIASFGPSVAILIGILLIIFVLGLIDKTLLKKSGEDSIESWIDLLGNPVASFFSGFLLTAVFFNVSVSLSIIVPIYVSKKIELKNIVPYLIGANDGAFSDALVLYLLTGNPESFGAVLMVMLGNCVMAYFMMKDKVIDSIVNATYKLLVDMRGVMMLLGIMVALPLLLVIL